MNASQQPAPLLLRILSHVPIIGFGLRYFADERTGPATLFLVNCVLAWIVAVLIWGHAAIILPALFLAGLMGLLLVGLTQG